MKVRMIRNPAAALGCQLTEGQTGEVDASLGSILVAAGLAECLDAPPEIKAVPPRPVIAEAAPPTEFAVERATEKLTTYQARQLKTSTKPPTRKESRL